VSKQKGEVIATFNGVVDRVIHDSVLITLEDVSDLAVFHGTKQASTFPWDQVEEGDRFTVEVIVVDPLTNELVIKKQEPTEVTTEEAKQIADKLDELFAGED